MRQFILADATCDAAALMRSPSKAHSAGWMDGHERSASLCLDPQGVAWQAATDHRSLLAQLVVTVSQ
jgi:hypothetical protein